MTEAVLVIGPAAVHGPHFVSDEMVSVAIDAIDDAHAVLEDRVVRVDELWGSVIAAAVGESVDRLILVCPGWWSEARRNRMLSAAAAYGAEPVLLVREEICATDADGVIQIAPDFVLAGIAGGAVAAVPRLDAALSDRLADAVTDAVVMAGRVVVDVPVGVADAVPLGSSIVKRLRSRGIDVRLIDDDGILRAARGSATAPDAPSRAVRRWRTPLAASVVLAGLGVVVLPGATPGPDPPSVLLIEGRVAVQLPAGWPVARVVAGPGSARLQASSPDDSDAAVLITQSPTSPDALGTAEALAVALQAAPPGVFTDFRAVDHRGGRAVVSYTEIRDHRSIDWAVFTDGAVRIAIGCQRATARPGAIRAVCDDTIRTARAAT